MNSHMGKVCVLCVKDNFDFCQKTVKLLLNDESIANKFHDVNLSSANSINWGRLFPQITYSINSYLELVKVNSIKIFFIFKNF